MHKRLPRSHHTNQRPSRKHPLGSLPTGRLQHLTWYAGLILGCVFVMWLLRPVFAILAASAGIAYVFDPLIDRFEERGWSRDQGIAITTVVLGLVFFLCVLLFIPPVVVQISKLSSDIQQVITHLDEHLQSITVWIEQQTSYTIDLNLGQIKDTLPVWIEQVSNNWQSQAGELLKGLFLRGMGLVNTTLNLLLLPVFTYYLLRDWDKLVADTFDLLPHSVRPVVQRTMLEVDDRLNAFIIGQIKVCLALAVLYSLGLWLVGIDLAFPIGIFSGLMFIIPYVGTVFGIVTAGLMALINHGFDWHILGVFAVFGASQMIEGYYLTPKIVGESVGLSPLVVMIALIVGAAFMGIWGMFLAIPVTAVLSVLAKEWLTQYRQSETFLKDSQ